MHILFCVIKDTLHCKKNKDGNLKTVPVSVEIIPIIVPFISTQRSSPKLSQNYSFWQPKSKFYP